MVLRLRVPLHICSYSCRFCSTAALEELKLGENPDEFIICSPSAANLRCTDDDRLTSFLLFKFFFHWLRFTSFLEPNSLSQSVCAFCQFFKTYCPRKSRRAAVPHWLYRTQPLTASRQLACRFACGDATTTNRTSIPPIFREGQQWGRGFILSQWYQFLVHT